jgi:DNA-binding MarR family transcriptional regulator
MPPRRPASSVQAEIQQGRPFRSSRQEAAIALLRTASVVRRTLSRVVEREGLTLAQYNALRIVGGAGTGGIATLAIRSRLIEEGTPITRLLDKLEAAGLIRRDRVDSDRRQVVCFVSADGKRLLARLNPIVDRADEAAVAAVGGSALPEFIAALDRIRVANSDHGGDE